MVVQVGLSMALQTPKRHSSALLLVLRWMCPRRLKKQLIALTLLLEQSYQAVYVKVLFTAWSATVCPKGLAFTAWRPRSAEAKEL